MSAVYEIRIRRHAMPEYIYGITWHFLPDGRVRISASLVPSGKAVYVWKSETSYLNERTEPQLPLLKPGAFYRFRFETVSEPEGCAMFRLVFYDRQNEHLETRVSYEEEMTFVYPEDAYRYTLELVQGGFDTMTFDRVILSEEQDAS